LGLKPHKEEIGARKRCRLYDNIKMDLVKTACERMHCLELAQDKLS
jgi:hypothetical protein